MMQALIPARYFALASLVSIVLAASGCTERENVTGAGPLPVAATAYPSPDSANQPVAKDAPQDIQELAVTVVDGRFESDVYAAQPRSTRMRITTRGGPYTFSVDGLIDERQLPADQTTTVEVRLATPGDYTMRLSGNASATATLNVRPAGSR